MKRSSFIVIIASSLALAACGAQPQPATEEAPQVEEQAAPAPAEATPAEAAPADTTAADAAAPATTDDAAHPEGTQH